MLLCLSAEEILIWTLMSFKQRILEPSVSLKEPTSAPIMAYKTASIAVCITEHGLRKTSVRRRWNIFLKQQDDGTYSTVCSSICSVLVRMLGKELQFFLGENSWLACMPSTSAKFHFYASALTSVESKKRPLLWHLCHAGNTRAM